MDLVSLLEDGRIFRLARDYHCERICVKPSTCHCELCGMIHFSTRVSTGFAVPRAHGSLSHHKLEAWKVLDIPGSLMNTQRLNFVWLCQNDDE